MKKKIYLYRLTDATGCQHITVVNDLSDAGCIYGIGNDGWRHQYDSYELYHAYEWAAKHGMKMESATMEIDIPNDIWL